MKVLIKREVGEVRETKRIKKQEMERGEEEKRKTEPGWRPGRGEGGGKKEERWRGAKGRSSSTSKEEREPLPVQGTGMRGRRGWGPLGDLGSVSGTGGRGAKRTGEQIGNVLREGYEHKINHCVQLSTGEEIRHSL